MSLKQVLVLAAANRRSSTYWSRVELGYDTMRPVKSFCHASPESVREFLKAWDSHVQVSWLASLDIGSVH